jgi:hypothetical protein
MDPGIYKLIHFVGIFFLLTGLGALIFSEKDKIKPATISHGVGLLLILLGGFGMQAKTHIGFPVWFTVKIAIWLVLGGMVVAIKKKLLPPVAAWMIVIVLCAVAAWLGQSNSVIHALPAVPVTASP